ncbi:MAG: hypothetical protein CVT60_03250 [Actinobacteria bacterium HGW-Actinobacteria-10]|jgi:hypothetical protein|nr:MAG: hypothetical protein CVT60_03250 [Actinobacteria bacterium HGW-Actinobacteria-10]
MLTEIQAALGAAVTMVFTFVPRLLAFAAVLLIGWLVAKALEKAMDAVLEKVGFDRVVERGGIKKALDRSSYDASSLLSRLVFYVVMLFVLQLSFGVWGPNPVSAMLDGVIGYMPNIFAATLIVVVGAAIAAAVADVLRAALGGLSYGKALATAASVAILVVAGFAALTQLQIAPAIVVGLFYAILAAVVGVIVVAFGGAGVQPMKAYWQRMLARIDREAPALSEAAKQMPDAAKQRTQERTRQAREVVGVGGPRPSY